MIFSKDVFRIALFAKRPKRVGLIVLLATSCLKQPESSDSRAAASSSPPTPAPPRESVTSDAAEWVSPVNKPCAGDPSPRWDPSRSGAPPLLVDGGLGHADGGITADAGGDVANAAKTVSLMRPDFRTCYQRLLDRRADSQGSVYLTIHVNCHGDVSWIHGARQGLDSSILPCLFDAVSRARFDPPPSGWANVRVPVNLIRAN
jgi:hypothetical protein